MRKLINARQNEIRRFFCIAQERRLSQSGKEIRKKRLKRMAGHNFRRRRYERLRDIAEALFLFECNLVALAWLSHGRGIIRIDILILWTYPVTLTRSVAHTARKWQQAGWCNKMSETASNASDAEQFPSAIKVSLIISPY